MSTSNQEVDEQPIEADLEIQFVWLGCVVNVLALILTGILFAHASNAYYKAFYGNKKNRSSSQNRIRARLPFNLVLINLSSACLVSLMRVFVQTNMFEPVSLNFSYFRCAFANAAAAFFLGIGYMTLLLIFLLRVQSIFKDSAFASKACTYRVLFWLIMLYYPLILVATTIVYIIDSKAYVRYDPETKLGNCFADIPSDYQAISASLSGLVQISVSMILLFMFLRGLWQLKSHLTKHFMHEFELNMPGHMQANSGSTGRTSGITATTNGNTLSVTTKTNKPNLDPSKSSNTASRTPTPTAVTSAGGGSGGASPGGGRELTTTRTEMPSTPTLGLPHDERSERSKSSKSKKHATSVSGVIDQWDASSKVSKEDLRPEITRIVKMHNLMKKQTILVCWAIFTTFALLVGVGLEQNFSLLFGFDAIVNSLCVWLMLDTSKKYWQCCRRYGICLCCYWQANKVGI